MIAGEREKIKLTISALVADFVYSVSANARNGGLIGLAATSISLAGVGHSLQKHGSNRKRETSA